MKFASRTDFGSGSTPYGDALVSARARGALVDLTVSNPTRCGFDYSAVDLQALSTGASLLYLADPLGALPARQAIASLFPGREADSIMLTASTSEAYSFLFRLFCNPGDAVLVPSPSYPLFHLLAALHEVELRPYPLVYHDGWQIDPAGLRSAVTERTRAIVAINPNNPTGHFCSEADRAVVRAVALEHHLPLIVDEVFLDYGVEGREASFQAAGSAEVLTFVMGGLSKTLALPQMKLAWTVVSGPQEEVSESLSRLEVIADTFLSVGTPVQAAVESWLQNRRIVQQQILDRVLENLRALDRLLFGTVVSRLKVEGGWSAVLRVPALEPDEALAVRLLQDYATAVHPGSLYGFPSRGWIVISLIAPPDRFVQGVQTIVRAFAG